MPTIDVYNTKREKVSEVELADHVFGAEVKEHLLHQVSRYQMAKRRAGTHGVKNRTAVSGGGRKPFRQKGTGRARAGTTRAAQWRGGGVVFGPTTRSYAFKVNRKERIAALCCALSKRLADGDLTVIDELTLPAAKTKHVVELLERFELADTVFVLSATDDAFERSARNLKAVTVLSTAGLNVYDLLRRKNLVLTADAVRAVTERLGA